jgi:hypothetical protein
MIDHLLRSSVIAYLMETLLVTSITHTSRLSLHILFVLTNNNLHTL